MTKQIVSIYLMSSKSLMVYNTYALHWTWVTALTMADFKHVKNFYMNSWNS